MNEATTETTRILWSGLTGRIGMEAVKIAKERSDVAIVAGMSRRNMDGIISINGEQFNGVRWLNYDTGLFGLYGLIQLAKRCAPDVIVYFSSPEVFDKVLELAIRTGRPLISGTSGLSNRQMATLYNATNHIPVFRGGNFRFKVKKFIDEAVKLAMITPGTPTLYENFYEGKSLPSETSEAIKRRILETTGKTINVCSSATFGQNSMVCDWSLDLGAELRNRLDCRTVGFDELAHDVLEIAKVMKNKPIKKGEPYDLDENWDDIPDSAKVTA